MRKELAHFRVGQSYGGDQEWFDDQWMKLGGCGAVTACDLCIYLARHRGLTALYPFDPNSVSKEDYLAFGEKMRPYLSPRPTGIHRTQTYVEGFDRYLAQCGVATLRLRSISGREDEHTAQGLIQDQIDRGFPVPYLMLRHRDKALKDYVWHWFLLNGYAEAEDAFWVKTVTYGEAGWLELRRLWQTGYSQKGGFVLIHEAEPEQAR